MLNKFSFNGFLIFTSIFITMFAFYDKSFYDFGLNNYYLESWDYIIYLFQLFVSVFLHWDIFHLLFNILFLYIFWYTLEILIWIKKYIIFFIFVIFFNWILITLLAWNSNTIGISWFAMAIISYYVMDLKSRNNPEYKWWITAIIVNIAIWFIPGISLYGHLFWAIAWVIFYLLNKSFFKFKFVWES